MHRNFAAAVAVFTFLFAVSAARISMPSDLPLLQTNCHVNSLPESATRDSNLVVLPSQTTRSGSDGADDVKKLDKHQDRLMFGVDSTPRSDFARFHAINRRFFDQRRVPPRPHRHFQNPFVTLRSEISHRDDLILTGETGKIDARSFHRRGPSTRLNFKHDYGVHHHRHQHHHHVHHNNNHVSIPKHKFAMEKTKSLVNQHREKTREREASTFMKSIRKFLKHTFD